MGFGKKGKVALFMNSNYKFYAGGKYHACLLANALVGQGIGVDVLTERPSPVLSVLDSSVGVVTSEKWEKQIENRVNDYDFVMGVPFDAAERAKFFAKRFLKHLLLLIFDVPNWEYSVKYNGDIPKHVEQQWRGIKFSAMGCSGIFCSTEIGKKYAVEYLDEANPMTFYVLNTPLNSKIISEIKDVQEKDKLIFISRFIEHKNYKTPVRVAAELKRQGKDFELVMIGGFLKPEIRSSLESLARKSDVKISLIDEIGDEAKFHHLAESKALLFPSSFEGFGMPPGEALCLDKPCIAYDLPVLRETYGDLLTYAKWGDESDYIKKAIEVIVASESDGKDKKAQKQKADKLSKLKTTLSLEDTGKRAVKILERICTFSAEQYQAGQIFFDKDLKKKPSKTKEPEKEKEKEPESTSAKE